MLTVREGFGYSQGMKSEWVLKKDIIIFMCAEPIKEFSHFIGVEEENVLKSIVNLGEDFFLIHNLDILFKNSLELEPLDDLNLKVPAFLYLIIHSEFYQGMAYFYGCTIPNLLLAYG